MSTLQNVVSKFLAEREQVLTALNNCPVTNMEDYWRWQGHAEARRTLREDLEREGIDLTGATPDVVAAIKADALREAAQIQRQYAADARTQYGEAEHTNIADWLDEHATAVDPARVEGAHP